MPNIAVIVSNRAANEHITRDAGFKSRKLVSKPRAYLLHKIVRRIKAPPEGIPPSKKENPKESPKIQRISVIGMLRLEYERQIRIKEIVETSAVPPRAKIVKSG